MYDGHLHGPFRIESLKFTFLSGKIFAQRRKISFAIEIKLEYMQISVAGGSGFVVVVDLFSRLAKTPTVGRMIETTKIVEIYFFSAGLNSKSI